MINGNPLVIRADAGSRMGTGHVMRCLALAQAWQDAGGRALFLTAAPPLALQTRLLAEGLEVMPLQAAPGSLADAGETARFAQNHEAAWVVADGYHFGADYQRLLKDSGLRLLFIDDYGHAGHYCADLVLNQNISAAAELYADREAHTRLLLGTGYALLRREFRPWRGWFREIPEVARKVLVTLGGSDPDNVTLKIIRALAQVEIEGLEAVVVVGGANPHLEELQAAVKRQPHRLRLERNVTNMPELMAWADVGLIGGGSTCFETALLGLPCLVIVMADNQRPNAQRLEMIGAAKTLGWFHDLEMTQISNAVAELMLSKDSRAESIRQSQQLVDGQGMLRVIKELGALD